MHTQLLNMGFVKVKDELYFNQELNLKVKIVSETEVAVPTSGGIQKATLTELEDAMVGGGFGEC